MKSKTYWLCMECKRTGMVSHTLSADVYAVLGHIRSAHTHLAPGCAHKHGLQAIRIVGVEHPEQVDVEIPIR